MPFVWLNQFMWWMHAIEHNEPLSINFHFSSSFIANAIIMIIFLIFQIDLLVFDSMPIEGNIVVESRRIYLSVENVKEIFESKPNFRPSFFEHDILSIHITSLFSRSVLIFGAIGNVRFIFFFFSFTIQKRSKNEEKGEINDLKENL